MVLSNKTSDASFTCASLFHTLSQINRDGIKSSVWFLYRALWRKQINLKQDKTLTRSLPRSGCVPWSPRCDEFPPPASWVYRSEAQAAVKDKTPFCRELWEYDPAKDEVTASAHCRFDWRSHVGHRGSKVLPRECRISVFLVHSRMNYDSDFSSCGRCSSGLPAKDTTGFAAKHLMCATLAKM